MSLPKPIHILLATPCYGGVLHRGYFHSVLQLQKLCQIHDIQLTVHTMGNESLIQRARNYYVALALSNPHITHLFYVDADISFNPQSVIRMIKSNKDITCGIYPKKGLNWDKIQENSIQKLESIQPLSLDYVINIKQGEIKIEDGYIPCLYGGNGFMMIKREVIETLRDKYPETKYKNDVSGYDSHEVRDHFYALFDCFICPDTKRYLSEDYAFCQRCINSGYTIWADLLCNLNHTGTYEFKGSFGQYMTHLHNQSTKEIEEQIQSLQNKKQELQEEESSTNKQSTE
jgi:hypothetical protein